MGNRTILLACITENAVERQGIKTNAMSAQQMLEKFQA